MGAFGGHTILYILFVVLVPCVPLWLGQKDIAHLHDQQTPVFCSWEGESYTHFLLVSCVHPNEEGHLVVETICAPDKLFLTEL